MLLTLGFVFPALIPFLALAGTAAGATLSVVQAQKQNAATKRSEGIAAQNAAAQQRALAQQAGVQRQQRLQNAHAIEGRLRVAAGESGVQFSGGSYQQLSVQNDITSEQNISTLDQNLLAQQKSISSGLDANLASLEGSRQNAVLSGFVGGLQGLSTGLSLGGGLSALNTPGPVGMNAVNPSAADFGGNGGNFSNTNY